MSKVLAKVSLKSLKIESVFKCLFLILLCIFVNNIYINITIGIFLLLKNKREFIIYLLILLSFYYLRFYILNLFKIGIVEYVSNSYSLINKGLYKIKFYNCKLNIGDVCLCNNDEYVSDSQSNLRNNIIFYTNSVNKISNLNLRKVIYDSCSKNTNIIKNIMLKAFYNISTYDVDDQIISYYTCFFYIINKLKKKFPYIAFILVIFNCLLFSIDLRSIFLLLELISHLFKLDKNRLYLYELLIIILINPFLLTNYSYLLIFIYRLINIVNFNEKPLFLSCLISSFLFKEINIIKLLFYKQIIIVKSIEYILLVFSFFFSPFRKITYNLNKYIYLLDNINFTIRGSLSVLGFFIFIYFYKYCKNSLLKLTLFFILLILPINYPFTCVSFIDVGQGDAILIKSYFNNDVILIDTGSKYNYYNLKKELFKNGIYKIDYLIITHNDEDHCGNIENLNNDFKVINIIDTPDDIKTSTIFLDNLNIGEYDNDNDNSLIYSLNINNISFLFTGDITSYVEPVLLKEFGPLKCDVLKVAHHGSSSSTSEYFVSNLNTKYAVISTSGKYNHPSPEVIKVLTKYKTIILNTKEEGTISFIFSSFANFIKTKQRLIIGI